MKNVKNYRPVTLINADYKLISGCVAARLGGVLPSLIHPDQTGVPGRRIADGIHIVSDVIEYCEREEVCGAIVSLDQEKCFDRVDHGFMFKVLAKYGFGPAFIGLVKSFYAGATSKVLVNGIFSEEIQLGRGVRQGDPPSSLLYVLTAEVLASVIRNDQRIVGITVNGVEKKIGGYADDTQGFLSTDASVQRFLTLVRGFGAASGSKLNTDKSEGLWLGPWRARTGLIHGLNWKDKIRILGVWLGRGDLVGANLQTPYEIVRARLRAWGGRPLSTLSKVRVANIFFFSSLWYRTEVIDPVEASRGNIPGYGEVEKEVGNWLFRGRRHEVSRDRLRDSYANGGAQLVDVADKVREDGFLEWGSLLEHVRVGYWNLYR